SAPTLIAASQAVLKACIAARAALAELRVSGQLIPNQAVLEQAVEEVGSRTALRITSSPSW
ncbi:hypothetical protein V5F77_29225, partial [Xanthobacter sp. DSM 24535]